MKCPSDWNPVVFLLNAIQLSQMPFMVNPTNDSTFSSSPSAALAPPDASSPELPDGDAISDREAALHLQKRSSGVRVSRRGILFAVLILIGASAFTFASISARRTQLTKTREVFGAEAITALQLSDQLKILPGKGQDFDAVNVTGTPGLGHLRRALLDESHYQWDTLQAGSVDTVGGDDAIRFTLQFEDPRGKRVPIIEFPLELTEGWVGTPDGRQRVKVTSRVQTALEFQLKMLKNVTQKTYDDR
ncbi:MAG: hypothetical protein AAF989_04565 [Planctomycetota bacterium]